MTKRNFLLGTTSGKLGDMVFYRAGGEQRTRTRVTPKNPKTIAQMTNRLLMLNVSSMFKSLAPILRDSFADRKANQSGFNAFVKENKSKNKYFLTRGMFEGGFCLPWGTCIAKGNMGITLEPTPIEMDRGTSTPPSYPYALDCLFGTKFSWDVKEGQVASDRTIDLTGEDLVKFIRQYSKVQLPNDFVITYVSATPMDYELNDEIIEPLQVAYGVMTVSGNSYTWEKRGCPDVALSPTLTLLSNSNVENTGVQEFSQVVKNGGYVTAKECLQNPLGIILSFKDASGLKVSTSIISSQIRSVDGEAVRGIVQPFLEGREAYLAALQEYGYSQGSVLSGDKLPEPMSEYQEEEEEEEEEG